MPPRIPRPCNKSGCIETHINPGGYCDKHKHTKWERHQQGKSSAQRGYGSAWRKLRQRVFERDHGLCQQCLRDGRVSAATDCDHIISKAKGGTDEMSNLQMLCRACHKAKTGSEQ